jgi:perosamine synthetase
VSINIPLSSPDIDDRDRQAVLDVLNGPVLSIGPRVVEFEQALARAAGRRHAVALSSGTAALHLIVRALGWGEGDEVITTPFSFVASANCLLYEKVRPVFVDIDPVTRCIDPARVEAAITPRTVGILSVDVFGVPADWASLEEIAGRHGLQLVTDSCESIGSSRRIGGRQVWAGQSGVAGAFAFYPNKQVTTGEGGAVVTDDDQVAAACQSMRNQGRDPGAGWLQHARLGFNFRMSELNAALGASQLTRLDQIRERRAAVAARYETLLRPGQGRITMPQAPPDTTVSWFVYVVELAAQYGAAERDRCLEGLRAAGIGCSNYFSPIHRQPYIVEALGHRPGDFPITERIAERTIALPFHSNLGADDQARVVEALTREVARVAPATSVGS